jgi:hypothetical protein
LANNQRIQRIAKRIADAYRYVSNGRESMHRLSVLLLASLLLSCATKHTHEASMVHEIHPDAATKCQFVDAIDVSEYSGWDETDERQNALNRLRNQVVLMGGNAFVLKQSTTSGSQTVEQADVYRCP